MAKLTFGRTIKDKKEIFLVPCDLGSGTKWIVEKATFDNQESCGMVKLIGVEFEMEMERVKVVIRYSDGRLIRGFTQDFFPTKEHFHLTADDNPSGGAIEVSKCP